MAASSLSSPASSSIDVNDLASWGDEEANRVDSGETAGPEATETAAMMDYPEYWIG